MKTESAAIALVIAFILITLTLSCKPQKKAHALTNEQIMIIYRQAYLNGYNARDLTYEQFKLRMTADSLKMLDLMR